MAINSEFGKLLEEELENGQPERDRLNELLYLLQRYEQRVYPDGEGVVYIELYADGSGSIRHDDDDLAEDWSTIEEMFTKLRRKPAAG